MSEFYDEYTDDELTNEFDSKAQITEEATKKVSTLFEKATENVSAIIAEEKKNIRQNKNNFKKEIEGKQIQGAKVETEKTCVFNNITKL